MLLIYTDGAFHQYYKIGVSGFIMVKDDKTIVESTFRHEEVIRSSDTESFAVQHAILELIHSGQTFDWDVHLYTDFISFVTSLKKHREIVLVLKQALEKGYNVTIRSIKTPEASVDEQTKHFDYHTQVHCLVTSRLREFMDETGRSHVHPHLSNKDRKLDPFLKKKGFYDKGLIVKYTK